MRFLISCFFFVLTIGIQAQKSLFLIIENGQYGFIDSTGKVVIAPRFKAVGTFSEGLAAAREGGYYGYIDTKGDWKIPPQYDYATEFTEGFAIAFKNGKPFYINHNGQVPFVIDKAEQLKPFKNGFATVGIKENVGLINKKGQSLLEPIYANIYDFRNGLFRVLSNDFKQGVATVGIIDTVGYWLVPLYKYRAIQPFSEGFAKVFFNKKEVQGFINLKGELVFELNDSGDVRISHDARLQDGVFPIQIYQKQKGEDGQIKVSTDYEGLMNLKGERVLNDTSIIHLLPVGKGLFKAMYKGGETYAIDKYGKHIPLKAYNEDTEDLKGRNLEEFLNNMYKESTKTWGRGELLKEKPFLKLDKGERLMTYIDDQDSIIWQAQPTVFQLDTLDIDYMSRGSFYARSESQANDQSYGGWGGSKNGSNTITQEMSFPKNKFTIEIRTTDTLHLEGKWMGYKVFVANNSTDTFRFDAQDSRLYMNMQAVDKQGVWRDIEYLPSSWCGNSYHVIALDPKQYWSFQTPLYKGSNPTRLRLKLMVKRKKGDKGYELYSNEIKGSINPAQFWRKQEYYPNGLMDPYND